MLNLMKSSLLVLGLGAVLSASAWDRNPPRPPRAPRIITVVGQGSGGTTHGDRTAACYRAQERAEYDAAQQCSFHRGFLRYARAGSCSCSKNHGSRDDYTCRAQARGECEIR